MNIREFVDKRRHFDNLTGFEVLCNLIQGLLYNFKALIIDIENNLNLGRKKFLLCQVCIVQ